MRDFRFGPARLASWRTHRKLPSRDNNHPMPLWAIISTHVTRACWLLRDEGISTNQHADEKRSSNYFAIERHILLDATGGLSVSIYRRSQYARTLSGVPRRTCAGK